MSTVKLLLCLAISISLTAAVMAGFATAQRHPVHTAVEFFLDDSSFVGLGTLSMHDDAVSMEISEVVKGAQVKRLTLTSDGNLGVNARDAQYSRVLVFIRGAFDPAKPVAKWRLMYSNPIEAGNGRPTGDYFSMGLRFLRTERELLQVSRDYVKHFPKASPAFFYFVPKSIAKVTGIYGQLTVPKSSRLKEIAIKMILNPKSFLPRKDQLFGLSPKELENLITHDEGDIRQIGASALANFKSDRNIKILKSCLDDMHIEPYFEEKYNVYWVRKAAYEALVHWGEHIQSPVLYAPRS